VWIVTDDADYADLGTLRAVVGAFGLSGTRVINQKEAAQAMRLCHEAGIDLRRKAIWKDRAMIHRYLYWRQKDNALTRAPDARLAVWQLLGNDPDLAFLRWLEKQDTTLAEDVKRRERELSEKLSRVDARTIEAISAKRLSIYVGVASTVSGPEGSWTNEYLRGLGHQVQHGRVTSGGSGITVHYRQTAEHEAKALGDLLAALFGRQPEMKTFAASSMASDNDVVIWFQ
jgi:hypothetical protein